MYKPICISALLALLFWGCTDNSSLVNDGGGATETTNGFVVSSTGAPVTNASLRLVADEDWLQRTLAGESVVLDTAASRENGSFGLHLPDSGTYNLEIIAGAEGAFISDYHSISPDTIHLRPLAALSGELSAAGSVPVELRLAGTSFQSAVAPDNSILFGSIPEGLFPIVSLFGQAASAPSAYPALARTSAGASLDVQGISPDTSIVLFDDFSQVNWRTSLSLLFAENHWYSFNDRYHPEGRTDMFDSILTGPASYDGSSRHTTMVLQPGAGFPYGGLGVAIGEAGTKYDFSALEMMTFMARGKGHIRVSIETELLDTLTNNDNNHFAWDINVPPVWTEISLIPDSLHLEFGVATLQGITWADAAPGVKWIEFTAQVSNGGNAVGDTVELLIDDIYLHGVPLRNFVVGP